MKAGSSLDYIDQLTQIGIALSSEKDHTLLLKKILSSAMALTNADAGTLYLLENEKDLKFEIIANKTLKISPKKVTKDDFPISSIPLYDEAGKPNLKNLVSYSVIKNQTQEIDDAYEVKGFDFSGMKAADKKLNYHSKSFLTIPLRNHANKIIGALQLINAMDEKTSKIIPFSKDAIHLAESLASSAAITLTNKALIEAQKNLFEAILQVIAKAIDAKSIYTSNHCTRVPILTMMIAEAVNEAKNGPFKDTQLTKDELEELRVSAWLHDCGKITVAEHIMNKATKLEALYDRIEVIDHRFEILKRDIKIALLEKALKEQSIKDNLDQEYEKACVSLNEAQQFIKGINKGKESLAQTDKEKVETLAKKSIQLNGITVPLLSKNDVENLSIYRGTLNDAEREIIKSHVIVTQELLRSLPYPEGLKRVPDIAGNHHERMDGKGYPRGLKGSELLVQSRIIAIADIFEAITAADRPYKTPNTLKEALAIMADFKKSGHIDPDLHDLLIEKKVFLAFAKKYLKPEQIDIPL